MNQPPAKQEKATPAPVSPQSHLADVRAHAKELGIPFLEEAPKKIEKAVINFIPEDAARKYGMVVFGKTDDMMQVAMLDPESFEALNLLRFLAEKEQVGVEIYITEPETLEALLRLYSSADRALKEAILSLGADADDENIDIDADESNDEEERKNQETEVIQDAPVARLVGAIVKHATEGKASDIHIEPSDGNYRVRFRIDGILHSSLVFPAPVGRAVVARIKILSNLKIDENRRPQDGRFRSTENGKSVDLRVSTFPVVDGEKVVMRVLDKNESSIDFKKLGLWARNAEILKKKIFEPYGIILITGPTGSGKSTTLYAFLQILNKEERNIVTLEDPVEYSVDGINQSQVKPEIGYTFAAGLRSILRQDPNVIMVGEIRDSETAELAIHAALTGHLVLSTLHTNDTIGAIPRLVDMGIEPFLLSSALQVVAAQRLVRRICSECKEKEQLTAKMLASIQEEIALIPREEVIKYDPSLVKNMQFFKGKGCDACGGSGYRGRVAIYETLDVNARVNQIITDEHANEGKLKEESVRQKMISMRQDGLLKAALGMTTLAEVARVTEGGVMIDEE